MSKLYKLLKERYGDFEILVEQVDKAHAEPKKAVKVKPKRKDYSEAWARLRLGTLSIKNANRPK